MQRLDDEQLARLRCLHRAAATEAIEHVDAVAAEVADLMALTPAWTAPHREILVTLGATDPGEPDCPQVTDLDFPAIGLTRAEWTGGGLYLELAPEVDEPDRWMMFKILGSEPRIWDVHAPDGTQVEHRMPGLFVRTRRVTAAIELTPGSY